MVRVPFRNQAVDILNLNVVWFKPLGVLILKIILYGILYSKALI
jgi:hypothetical protein